MLLPEMDSEMLHFCFYFFVEPITMHVVFKGFISML